MHQHSNSIIGVKDTDAQERDMEIVPAINVFKGMPVSRGEVGYEPLIDSDGASISIDELLDELKGRYEQALITDINGINRDRPQLELLRAISSKMKLWVDAGPRHGEGVIDILVTGAEKIVLGTKTLRNLEELKNAVALSENVVLDIDYDDRIVSPEKGIGEMSPLRLAGEAKSYGIEEIIFTDLKHLSSPAPFSLNIGSTLLGSDMMIFFHGRFESDIATLKGKDLAGLIIEVETLL